MALGDGPGVYGWLQKKFWAAVDFDSTMKNIEKDF